MRAMAKRTSDHESAADVAKVERDQYEDSLAAEAADDVVPAAPADADERADALADQPQDDPDAIIAVEEGDPLDEPVELRLAEDFDAGDGDKVLVSVPGHVDVEVPVSGTITVSEREARDLEQSPAVERVS